MHLTFEDKGDPDRLLRFESTEEELLAEIRKLTPTLGVEVIRMKLDHGQVFELVRGLKDWMESNNDSKHGS